MLSARGLTENWMHGRAELGRNRNCPHTLFTVDALTHTHPADCKFLFNECWFPMSCRGRSGEEGGRGEGAFEASISCLRFALIKNFLKAFCGTSTWKPSLSEMRDETRWDELSDMARETHKWGRGRGSEKRNFVKLEINLRFVCCRSYCAAAAVATLTPAGRQSIFFCVHFVLLLFLLHLAIWLWPGV